MTRAQTQEEFIAKAIAVHGDCYSYDKVVYIKSNTKVVVTCKKHSDWEVTPNNHLKRKCPHCARGSSTKAAEEFVQKARIIHGDKYDYSLVEYRGALEQVSIKCTVHGVFETKPAYLLSGFGCSKCSYEAMAVKKTKSQEQFLREAIEVHGDKYDLSKVNYTDCRDKIIVTCPLHDAFLTQANSFLQGHGCPGCMEGGYSQLKEGTLYVMTAGNICKVGITNKSAKQRANLINKSSKLGFSPVFEMRFDKGVVPLTIETTLLRELRATHTQPTEKFDGSTECFYHVDHEWLLARINELIKEHYGNRPDQYNRST